MKGARPVPGPTMMISVDSSSENMEKMRAYKITAMGLTQTGKTEVRVFMNINWYTVVRRNRIGKISRGNAASLYAERFITNDCHRDSGEEDH